jgi:YihY family inner membrane protein
VVGLATILHAAKFRDILRHTITRLAPGPASDIIVAAFKQGARTVGGGARAALLFGVVATLISAATAMSQVERGANQTYGVDQDRPTLKYGVGLLLACTTGRLMVLAFVLIVAGADIAKATNFSGVAWEVLRWPLSILFLVIAVALLLKAAPKQRQPAASWLAVGSALAVLLWFAFTGLLALYLGLSTTFGQTYGPLAGMIGILAWALLTSLAAYLGLTLAALARGGPGRRPRPDHGAAGQQPGPGTSPAGRPPLRPAAEQHGGVERLRAEPLAQKRDERLPEGGAA